MSASDPADPTLAAADAELARLRAEADAADAQVRAAQARAALAAQKPKREGESRGRPGREPDAAEPRPGADPGR